MGCLSGDKPKAGVEQPGPITQPRSQGAAQCCAIPGRFCCTIFYAIAGGFGFRYVRSRRQSLFAARRLPSMQSFLTYSLACRRLGADAAQSMVNAL